MRRPLFPLYAVLALMLVPAVDAQPESAYYGLSIGEFDYSDHAVGLGAFSDSVGSWRATIGYQFFKHFAFEGSYGETSTVRDTVSGAGSPPAELGFETQLGKIVTLRGLGTFPFENGVSLMVGVGFANLEQDIALSVNGAPFLGGEVDKSSELAYYAGAQYDWDRVALRLSYEKWDFDSVPTLAFVAGDAQEVALSFFYKL